MIFRISHDTEWLYLCIHHLIWSIWRTYLCVWGRQALANVHPKQGVLAEGDVELKELWEAEVEQGPPKHTRRDFLCHTPSDLNAACVYTAVSACPRTWSKGERNCIICDCMLRSSESIANNHSLVKIICCKNSWQLLNSGGRAPLPLQTVRLQFMLKGMLLFVTVGCKMMPL